MELFEIMQKRRSIRKYQSKEVEKEKLERIVEAGLFAPSAGGRQGTKFLVLEDRELIERIGIVNAACENRDRNVSVSAEQPSILDDKKIRSGFYGCPALVMVCIPKTGKTMVNAIGSAFTCAENMVLQAYDLGVSSVIVGRAEATFSQPEMADLLIELGLDPEYMPIVFVCLGYIDGEYPRIKPRREGRVIFCL